MIQATDIRTVKCPPLTFAPLLISPPTLGPSYSHPQPFLVDLRLLAVLIASIRIGTFGDAQTLSYATSVGIGLTAFNALFAGCRMTFAFDELRVLDQRCGVVGGVGVGKGVDGEEEEG